jgi:DNA-dependent protein kinase catalytic subunit
VKEPLLDWGIDKENESIKKVEIVNMKLNGYNPVKIMLREINAIPRLQSKIKDILKTILYGINGDNVRLQNKNENYVDIDIQVDILNELATDPNLLGRMWIGWSPFI